MLSTLLKRSSAAISASGALRVAISGRNSPSIIDTFIKRPFSSSKATKIQGDHDWFLIPPKKYWKPTPPSPPTPPSSACLACKNLSCAKSGASLAKKQAEDDTTKTTSCTIYLKYKLAKLSFRLALLRAIFAGKILVCVVAFGVSVMVVDDVLLATNAFGFVDEWYKWEMKVDDDKLPDNVTISIDYKLRPSQWVLLAAVKGLGNAANGSEYGKVWSGVEEELEPEA